MKETTIQARSLQQAFVAYTNTDCTEGRGMEYPLVISTNREAVVRLSKGKYVQGTDCPIYPCEIFNYDNKMYGPVKITIPNDDDKKLESARLAKVKLEEEKKVILEKALALGLTQEEIDKLKK